MKKIYEKPIVECIGAGIYHLLVSVSGTSGSLSDGTEIGGGGDDDGEVISAAKRGLWDDFDE